jgi:serine/threonine-protein phosphatase 4 regulatory subunit 2
MSPLDLAAKRHLSPQPNDISALMDGTDPIVLEGDGPVIGLVDELDDPSPGHLSDHPTALSATTTVTPEAKPMYGSLEERFVKSSTTVENEGQSSMGAQPEGGSDDMVLDDPDSDHDKENKL